MIKRSQTISALEYGFIASGRIWMLEVSRYHNLYKTQQIKQQSSASKKQYEPNVSRLDIAVRNKIMSVSGSGCYEAPMTKHILNRFSK
jgi:hypothetical protein